MNTWYKSLSEYFPPSEMKSKRHFKLLLADKSPAYAVEEKPDSVLVYFEQPDFIFVDYLLVHSSNRSKGIGGAIMNKLKQKNKPIILEVEPDILEDPDTGKRIRFYKKAGFKHASSVHYTRIHPATNELNEMEIYFWSPEPHTDSWAVSKMETVYKDVHAYQSQKLYNVEPQPVEDVFMLKADLYQQAK